MKPASTKPPAADHVRPFRERDGRKKLEEDFSDDDLFGTPMSGGFPEDERAPGKAAFQPAAESLAAQKRWAARVAQDSGKGVEWSIPPRLAHGPEGAGVEWSGPPRHAS